MPQGVQGSAACPWEFHEERRHVELPVRFAIGENGVEHAAGARAAEVLLVRGLFVGMAGAVMPSTPSSIISLKKSRTLLGSAPSKSVVLVVTRKPRFKASRMPSAA